MVIPYSWGREFSRRRLSETSLPMRLRPGFGRGAPGRPGVRNTSPERCQLERRKKKCCCAITRVKVTVEAAPYARTLLNVPGYSCAKTLAIDQAMAHYSDGKDCPPWKNFPALLSTSGSFALRNFFQKVSHPSGINSSLAT